MNRKSKVGLLGVVVALVLAGGYAVVWMLLRPDPSHRIYRAWHVNAPTGAVIVVEHSTHRRAVRFGGDTRRDVAAVKNTRLYSYRLKTGERLGTYALQEKAGVIGVSNDKLWMRTPSGPALVSAIDFSLIADRKAIHAAVANSMGGDFELSHPEGMVHAYDRHLEVKGADGKDHYITDELKHLHAEQTRSVPPPGYRCDVHLQELFKAQLVQCLPPESAPVTALATAYASALKDDVVVLSAVEAGKVLWKKPITQFAAGTEPASLLGSDVIAPRRVLLLLQTGDEELHAVYIDPADGRVLESTQVIGKPRPVAER